MDHGSRRTNTKLWVMGHGSRVTENKYKDERHVSSVNHFLAFVCLDPCPLTHDPIILS
jgi:hypothetical protein